MRPSFPWRSPAVAAVLSFLFPGLGQAAAGQPRRGAIVAIPSLSLVAAIVAVAVYARHDLLGTLLSRDWLTSLLIVDLIALAYHLWAVADAYKLARPAAPSKRREPGAWATIGVLSLVVVATVGVHLSFGVIVLKSQQAVSCAGVEGARNCLLRLQNDDAKAQVHPHRGYHDQAQDPDGGPGSRFSPFARCGRARELVGVCDCPQVIRQRDQIDDEKAGQPVARQKRSQQVVASVDSHRHDRRHKRERRNRHDRAAAGLPSGSLPQAGEQE